jgi:hypothetical protein
MSSMVIFCRLALLSIALAQGALALPSCSKAHAEPAQAAVVADAGVQTDPLRTGDLDSFMTDFENN